MNWLSKLFSEEANQPTTAPYDGAVIIDVRSPGEFASGHVEGALNLPLDRLAQNYKAVAPDKEKQIVVYCLSGARSAHAMQFLKTQGYANVFNGGSVGAVARTIGRKVV